jgi:radical SAM superfamily enzyme with C-terminal helix-hairpin-helix motif
MQTIVNIIKEILQKSANYPEFIIMEVETDRLSQLGTINSGAECYGYFKAI